MASTLLFSVFVYQINYFSILFYKVSNRRVINSLLFRIVQLRLNFFATITLNDSNYDYTFVGYHITYALLVVDGSGTYLYNRQYASLLIRSSCYIMSHTSLFQFLSKSHESQRLRSSHTVISEVYSVVSVVDFTYISSLLINKFFVFYPRILTSARDIF